MKIKPPVLFQNKFGSGEDCLDENGNILEEGSTRSCAGQPGCNTINRLCGTNKNNRIVNSER